jgi:hypothetical protein
MNPAQIINKTFNFKLGGLDIAPTYWQAAAIIFLLFALVSTLARMRHLYIKWSFSGWPAWLFMGFLLALVLEGFLLLGGRTVVTGLLGWKNPPKPISTALEVSRAKLVDVLGVTDEIPSSIASEEPTYSSVVFDFQSLSQDEAKKARSFICQP